MRESRTGTFRSEFDLQPFTQYPKCADLEDPEIMQPYEATGNSGERAKGVCVGCAAFPECRAEIDRLESMRGGAQIGVWAGETYTERRFRRYHERLSASAGSVQKAYGEGAQASAPQTSYPERWAFQGSDDGAA